jgi:hypothetical protein
MWKIDQKDKHIHKTKHDHIHIYIENMFEIVELFYGTRGREEGKENDRASTIAKYIASVQEVDMVICIESC